MRRIRLIRFRANFPEAQEPAERAAGWPHGLRNGDGASRFPAAPHVRPFGKTSGASISLRPNGGIMFRSWNDDSSPNCRSASCSPDSLRFSPISPFLGTTLPHLGEMKSAPGRVEWMKASRGFSSHGRLGARAGLLQPPNRLRSPEQTAVIAMA